MYLLKMISFAWNGFTSFSAAPLRWILYLGVIMSMFSIFGMLWIISVYFMGKTIQGWSSIIIMVLFFGGINMFTLGVIGEYIRKIFIQTKRTMETNDYWSIGYFCISISLRI